MGSKLVTSGGEGPFDSNEDVARTNDTVVALEGVRKEYGDVVAVESADLSITRGEFFSLLGPSGCGKTTLLRMIAGFETPSAGRVLLEGKDVSQVPPYKRNVNTVFQQYALFPHMSVLDNVAFGLRAKKVGEAEAARRAREMLDVVKLGDLARRRPDQLSGGQQQRVALARALVNLPSALLLDEPLAALDLKLREAMQIELKRIQREVGITFVFVTHDQHEALTMSDRIAVMSRGRVEQIGTPQGVYGRPASVFVAAFIGSANLLPGSIRTERGSAEVVLDGGARVAAGSTDGLSDGAPATVMIRPERLKVLDGVAPDGRSFSATVGDVIFQGQDIRLIAHLADGTEVIATVDADFDRNRLVPGASIVLGWAPGAQFVLPGRSTIVGATTTDLDEVQASLDGTDVGERKEATAEEGEGETRIGRRAFLIGASVAGAAAVVGGVLAMTGGRRRGSGIDLTPGVPDPRRGEGPTTLGTGSERLRILNWQAYIDPSEGGVPGTVERFAEATGIDVTYSEALNDNREFYAREIEPYLGTGIQANFDIVCPTYWLAARMKSLGWVEPLPVERIPNKVNLEERFLDQPWDYGAVYSLPWQAGITGIAYDPELTGREIRSVLDLFDPRFKGRVAMLQELHDSVGLTMLALGHDPSKVDEAGAMEAMDRIAAAAADGQFRAFTGNDFVRSLESGDFIACLAWSADILQLQYARPGIRFVIPEEGGISFYDTMVIPKGAPNAYAAADWMNFVYDPVQAARITARVQGVTPVKGVREELVKLGGDAARLGDNPILFPPEEVTERLYVFAALPEDVEARLNERFLQIIGG